MWRSGRGVSRVENCYDLWLCPRPCSEAPGKLMKKISGWNERKVIGSCPQLNELVEKATCRTHMFNLHF